VEILTDWQSIVGVSKTIVSIHACPEPPMRRGSRIHDQLFQVLRDFNADYPRLSPWFPYPKLAVAELRPPSGGQTSWDFSLIDPIVDDFIKATSGHPVIFNPSTLPRWMFTSTSPVSYPENPDEICWAYAYGDRKFTPTTAKLFAEYQGRLAGWFLKGGFKDEYGQWHQSGHHYPIGYWEVFNEPDGEDGEGSNYGQKQLTPAQYVRFYDAVVEAVRAVEPTMKFAGPAFGDPVDQPDYFEYFLDPHHHRPGIPIDLLTYHFYSIGKTGESPATMQWTIFEQADKFIATARYIDAIRRRLSPKTLTAIDEVGSVLPGALEPRLVAPIPKSYWNLTGAMWAYLFGHLTEIGVDIVNVAELIDYPGQCASTTLVDWETGEPNARYWIARLLRENFKPGDKIVAGAPFSLDPVTIEREQIYTQGYISSAGERKLLVVNKRDSEVQIRISGATGGWYQCVSQSTTGPSSRESLISDTLNIPALGVMVVRLGTKVP